MYDRTERFRQLLQMGITRYQIAKRIQRSYDTVNYWYRGTWKPDVESTIRLENLYKQVCYERGIKPYQLDLFEQVA